MSPSFKFSSSFGEKKNHNKTTINKKPEGAIIQTFPAPYFLQLTQLGR